MRPLSSDRFQYQLGMVRFLISSRYSCYHLITTQSLFYWSSNCAIDTGIVRIETDHSLEARSDVQQKSKQSRNRITWQPKHQLSFWSHSEEHWLTRTDIDPPKY